MVLTNPPFGTKSSITVVNAEGEEDHVRLTYNQPDFWTTTSNMGRQDHIHRGSSRFLKNSFRAPRKPI